MPEDFKIILILTVGLGIACAMGYIAQRLKLSPLLGYLLGGFLIGPNSPGFVADQQISQQLASIGVTLLMFAVGLNFNWNDLLAVKRIALPGAITLATLSICAGIVVSLFFGFNFNAGLVIGLAVCVSSTVVIVRVLTDQQLLQTKQGHAVLGWTIVEDLISVFGLILLPALVFSEAQTSSPMMEFFQTSFWVILKVVALALIVYFVGDKFVDRLLKIIARSHSHELFTLAILSLVFFIAIGSSLLFGVSLALGAFIAGTVVGKTELSHQAAANALPMRDAFAVIFFLSVGMLFNPVVVINNLALFLGLLLIILLFRPLIAFFIVTLAKYPASMAVTIAIAIAQIGEYSFILAQEGNNLNILPRNAYDVLVACSFISIMLNPFLFKYFTGITHKYMPKEKVSPKSIAGTISSELEEEFLPRAIVVGYGIVGQAAVERLELKKYNVTVIERNIDTVEALKEKKMHSLYGDASQFRILEKVDFVNVRLLVITVPSFHVTQAIIKTAQAINPFVTIIARCHFKAEKVRFDGISIVCDEEASAEKMLDEINALK